MVDLSVRIGGLRLKNPIMPASGTFSEKLGAVFDLNRLGALVPKSIYYQPRKGNPTPRVAEVQDGMLNSIGLPCDGIEHFVDEILPHYRDLEPPVIVSISADTAEEFGRFAEAISVPGVDALELNISCPNFDRDGRAFAQYPEDTHQAVRSCREATDLALWAKLTPNVTSIQPIAKAAEEAGSDALVVGNTILAMAIDTETFRPKLGSVTGGMSGPAVKPIYVRLVFQCARAVSIPVIGVGGIATPEDVIEFMLAGATAVQVGTITFVHPGAMAEILDGIEAWCNRRGIARVDSLVGDVDLEPDQQIMEYFA